MSEMDEAKNKVQDLKGHAKEKVGSATDNDDLESAGRSDQAKAAAKDVGEKVKDAGAKIKDAVTGK